jgi:hypothetical protein
MQLFAEALDQGGQDAGHGKLRVFERDRGNLSRAVPTVIPIERAGAGLAIVQGQHLEGTVDIGGSLLVRELLEEVSGGHGVYTRAGEKGCYDTDNEEKTHQKSISGATLGLFITRIN